MKHPNATTALVSAGAGGTAVVEILDQLGVDVSASTAVWLAGAAAAFALWFGKRGIVGVARLLWRGERR